MKIQLLEINIANFKGIQNFAFQPNGDDVTIFGENGVGKTTVYDSLLWLFFGKNSEGKTDFDLRPLDENNVAVKGLVLAVGASLSIDGESHTFRKEHHEKVVRGQLTGFESRCFIDEVPKKKGEYEAAIADIIPEDIFKMLTDLQKFNTMHWTDRRKILLDIAGDIGTPKGFDKLIGKLKGRSMADFKKVLSGQKTAYAEERDEINPRLDEIHKGLGELEAVDTETAGTQRAAAITEKADLQEQKTQLLDGETARQRKVDAINELKVERISFGNTLKQGDPSKIGPLLREKMSWEETIAVKRDELSTLRKSISDAETNLADTENQLTQKTSRWSLVSDEYRDIQAREVGIECPSGPDCPYADKSAQSAADKAEKLQRVEATARKLQKEREVLLKVKATQKEHRDKLAAGVAERETELAKLLEEKESGLAEIEKKIAACKEGVRPEDDHEWKRLDGQITASLAKLGPSLAAGIGVIDNQIDACQKKIDAANLILANTDTIKTSKDRIAELEAREKELAQLIADIDKQLADIGKYKAEESRLIEAAVNGKFKHVKFKLFETLLNGSIEDTCVCMLDGTPYSGMSTGETVIAGIDIINVLSVHYDVSVVLFIDHLESLTLPIETDAQVIGLYAEKGRTELTVKGN